MKGLWTIWRGCPSRLAGLDPEGSEEIVSVMIPQRHGFCLAAMCFMAEALERTCDRSLVLLARRCVLAQGGLAGHNAVGADELVSLPDIPAQDIRD